MRYPSLRPHHGMCFQFYEGKGYSHDFTDHMGKVIKDFTDDPGQEVCLSVAVDIVCENCPNNKAGECVSRDKVTRYDEEVLRICGISNGDVMPYASFLTLVRVKITDAGLRSSICGDCCWDTVCRKHRPGQADRPL